MDKEMMAKVNEILRANGRRELKMEDMEQVVGGISLFGKILKTEEDIQAVTDIAYQLELAYGTRDIVAVMIKEQMQDMTTVNEYRTAGAAGLYNRLYDLVICRSQY